METKKVLGIIFSVLFIGAFAFVLSWCIINFNKVQDGLSGTGVYTKEDLDNAYKDGYSTALDNEKTYTELIDSYRDTITFQSDEISKLSSKVSLLTNTNKDYLTQIVNLDNQKTNLEEQVFNLNTIKINNENTIKQLNKQITELEQELLVLENSGEDKDETIAQKNTQIINLQSTVSQLQKTNELNVDTITNLNNQIASLNTQITDMTLQIQNNSTNVTALNNKIAELEKSVAYYEQYIANLENGEQVVATFEFNGSVYNIQIVNKNDTVSVLSPTSTDYVIFNYWTVNGEQIDLSTYQITSNVKIVANVTLKYDVKFMVDETEYNNQIVIKNGYATIPTDPTKTGYEFDGWTTNGVDIVDPNTTIITQNTTYVAKFTKLHTVTFMYEDTTYTTQTVRNNEYSTNVIVNNTDYKVFNGWKLNGVIVDVTTQKIVADTTFIADITYKYDVKFMVDDTEYNNQIVIKNGYATKPDNPIKTGYEFDGWTTNGVDIINPNTIVITQNTTYIAKFTKLHTVTFIYEDTTYTTQIIRDNNYSNNVMIDSTTYKIFNGWKLNGVIVDVTTQKIVADTTFIADITYKYDVKFMVDGSVYSSQIITINNYATIPANPTKTGYEFDGWSLNGVDVISNISSIKVTTNTTYIATFTQKTLEQCSWSEIKTISKNGQSSQMFKVGDTKNISLTNGNILTVVILGFNHDDLSNGNGKAGITFGLKSLMADKYKMNSSQTNIGGWGASDLRTTLNSDIFNTLPSELQSAISSVNKKASSYDEKYGSRTTKTTSDKLFLFSAIELTGKTTGYFAEEGSQYTYFADKDNSYFYSYKLNNGNGDYRRWWLRSAGKDGNYTGFLYTGTNYETTSYSDISSGKYDGATCEFGISFGFCI